MVVQLSCLKANRISFYGNRVIEGSRVPRGYLIEYRCLKYVDQPCYQYELAKQNPTRSCPGAPEVNVPTIQATHAATTYRR